MKTLFAVVLASSLAAFLAAPTPRADEPRGPASRKMHGPGCAGGCAAVHDAPPEASPERIRTLLAALADKPAGRDCPELDEILFLGAPVDASRLPPEWQAFLNRELARTEVTLTVRILAGEEPRVELVRDLRLGVKGHLPPDRAVGVTPPEISLTVRRVGLDHLWTRI